MKETAGFKGFSAEAVDLDPVAFAAWRRDGTLLTANQSFYDLTGYSRADAGRLSWLRDFLAPEPARSPGDVMVEIDGGGIPVRCDVYVLKKNGVRLPADIFMHRYTPRGSAEPFYYSFITPLSSPRFAGGDRKRAEYLSDLYLTLIAHDLDHLDQAGMCSVEIALNGKRSISKLDEEEISLLETILNGLTGNSGLIGELKSLQTFNLSYEPEHLSKTIEKIGQRYQDFLGGKVMINHRRRSGR